MSKERTLVVLVATDAFLAFSVCGVEAFFQWTLPSPLREFVGGSGHPSFRQFGMLWLWGLTAACAITAWIGLVNYWWFARRLYIASMTATLLLRLASGPVVMTPLGAMLDTLDWAAGGAILGLVYLSDLSRRFERRTVPVVNGAQSRA
ncbi:MAG: hypothetical protein E6K72_04355 [Candidatus Eisenbacteria bacterium]|uniref:Uncharacterized protein n=1 Tax=Eiseniibacteriota bacterium TaxID=2212470 RepID=A0A538SZJ3_UNCEI|nr:MAG: hypothetical protein E6K72_04355 [Candidatus Eisenbacteria bacterium]